VSCNTVSCLVLPSQKFRTFTVSRHYNCRSVRPSFQRHLIDINLFVYTNWQAI